MDKAQLIEILSREHNKSRKDISDWLGIDREKAKQDLGLTFYWICRVLALSSERSMLSRVIQEHVTKSVTHNEQQHSKWNPVDWFNAKWIELQNTGSKEPQASVGRNSETKFDPEYTKVLHRDKQRFWRMWLADPYEEEVRCFFGAVWNVVGIAVMASPAA